MMTIVCDLVTFEPTMPPDRRSQVIERWSLGSAPQHASALLCARKHLARLVRAFAALPESLQAARRRP